MLSDLVNQPQDFSLTIRYILENVPTYKRSKPPSFLKQDLLKKITGLENNLPVN